MFGAEDRLLHKLASATNLFTANHMQERFWPVHVSPSPGFRTHGGCSDLISTPQAVDVGSALEIMIQDDSTASETYELHGPKNYSLAEIAEMVDKEIIKHRRHINLPKALLKPAASVLSKAIYWPTVSPDEVEREFLDQTIDRKAKTFKDLGIEPGDVANYTFHYLVRTLWTHIHYKKFDADSVSIPAKLSQLFFLRSATCVGAGETGREEVSTCYRRSIVSLSSVSLCTYRPMHN